MKKIFIVLAVTLLSSISYADITKHKQYKIDVSICPIEKTKTEIKIFKNECKYDTAFYYASRGCCSRHGGQCGCDMLTGRVKCCDGKSSLHT